MTQAERLYDLLKDGHSHRTDEILLKVYGSSHNGITRIGARIADLKEGRWPGKVTNTIEGWHDPQNAALYWYKLVPAQAPMMPPAFNEIPTKLTKNTYLL